MVPHHLNSKPHWITGFLITAMLNIAFFKSVGADIVTDAKSVQASKDGTGGSGQAGAEDLQEPLIIDVLDLKSMDILDVLKLVSQKSGLNIVAGQSVQGKVNVFLKNVEVHQALKIIVESYGWAYVQDNGIIRVMSGQEYEMKYGHKFGQTLATRIRKLAFARTEDVAAVFNQMKSASGKIVADAKSSMVIMIDEEDKLQAMEEIIAKLDAPVTTRVFILHHAMADDISAKINEMLTPSAGFIKIDERLNRMVVSDTASKMEAIQRVVEAFDHKDREVLIEAKILQVTLSDEQKLGIDWEAMVNDYHSLKLTGNFDVLAETDKAGKVSIGTIAADQYTALLEALETVGHTEILSSPRIMAVNNKEAKILVGSTEPYVTTTVTTPSAGPTTTAESVNFIEVGVKLYVTPTIHEDDFITLKIRPEVSSVVKNVTTSNNNTIPVIETSEAETTVVVKDKVTIIIGGLIKEEKITSAKKIPLLGDLPVLGYAFRSKSDLTRKTEIVIFITPKIVSGDIAG